MRSLTNNKVFLKGGGFVETRLLKQALRARICCSLDIATRQKWQNYLEELEIIEMMSVFFA